MSYDWKQRDPEGYARWESGYGFLERTENMKYEHQLEDALLRMAALYEGEHDADAPMDKPYWLSRALDAIASRYPGYSEFKDDEVKCPHCGAARNRGDGFRCCPAAT